MTLILNRVSDTVSGVTVTQTAEGLHRISGAGSAAMIWHRQPLAGFQSWIDHLDPDTLPVARLTLRPNAVRHAITTLCDMANTPDSVHRTQFIDDVAALADIFAGVMQTEFVKLRLDKVTRNACRKFHADAITARLICTYRGPGTQYGISNYGADPKRIFAAPTGAPILMRGTKWVENPRAGMLHRSPPIEGTGVTRLVLVLDPVPKGDAL